MAQILEWDGWISLTLPNEWVCEKEDDIITLFKVGDGLGAFQISFGRHSPPKVDVEKYAVETLGSFARRNHGQEVTLRAFRPNESEQTVTAHTSFVSTDEYWESWLVSDAGRRVLITYNCGLEDRGVEKAAYGEILRSMTFHWVDGIQLLAQPWYWLDA